MRTTFELCATACLPPEGPRETHASERLWKVPPPWEPASKSARSHRGLEAVGFHTSHNPDGGFTYEPLTRGWVLFSRSGWALFTLSKRDDCIEDDTRERCAVSLAVARIFYRTGVFDSCQRYRYYGAIQ